MNVVQVSVVLLTLLLGCTFVSCESPDYNDAQEVKLALQLSTNKATTRDISSTAENTLDIAQLKVLVFKVENGIEKFVYIAPSLSMENGGYVVTLRKSANGEAYRLVVIANSGEVLPSISLGTVKNDALRTITFSSFGVWKAAYRYIPMWGESANAQVITETTSLSTITLIRSLARIDVGLSLNGNVAGGLSNFTLRTVSVYRTRDTGYVAPVDATSITNNLVSSVSIPTGAGRNGSLTYTSPDGKSLLSSIYVAETEKGTTNGDQVCLVIGGLFNGTIYYYRVDLSNADGYVPLKRNCRYIVNITEVNVRGYNTEAESIRGEKLLNYGLNISAVAWGSEINTDSGNISL